MLIAYTSTLLEFICLYYATKSLSHASYKPNKNDLIAALAILLVLGSIPENCAALSWFLGQLSYFLYITLTYSKEKLNNIFLFCLSFALLLIIQFITALFLCYFPINLESNTAGILGNSMTFVLAFFLLHLKPIKDIYFKVIHSILPYRLLLLNSYLVLFVILLIFKLHPNNLYYNLGNVLIISIFLIMTNACVLYYDQKMNLQKQQLLSYQKNLPIYESLINEIRDNQHEYSHHLQSLQNLTETCKDYNSLYHALKKYTHQYAQPLHAYPLLQINMPLLAASLYNLSSRAESDGIIVRFDVVSETLNSLASEIQLTDFTSTLLQNAIEACQPTEHIYIHLSSQNGLVEFEIRNPVKHLFTPQEIARFSRKTTQLRTILSKTTASLMVLDYII